MCLSLARYVSWCGAVDHVRTHRASCRVQQPKAATSSHSSTRSPCTMRHRPSPKRVPGHRQNNASGLAGDSSASSPVACGVPHCPSGAPHAEIGLSRFCASSSSRSLSRGSVAAGSPKKHPSNRGAMIGRYAALSVQEMTLPLEPHHPTVSKLGNDTARESRTRRRHGASARARRLVELMSALGGAIVGLHDV